jgi:protein-tyrosine phosphatase
MKALQGMITLYFVSKGNTNIQYWNATHKLKMFVQEKTTYAQRKKIGIVITRQIIEEKYKSQLDYFSKHKKKDDLSDCFLQLIDYMKKENKLESSISQFLETIHIETKNKE